MGKPVSDSLSKKNVLNDKFIASVQGITRKGASTPYSSLNGHMYIFISKEEKLALRLHRETVCVHETIRYNPMRAIMKEYVVSRTVFSKSRVS